MELLIGIYIFVIGLAFGSFVLAMVDRMKAGKDWVGGRSECDHCKHKLSVRDLVPLVSWLAQKGRCRHCSKKLSVAYPITELAMGVSFVFAWGFFPFEISGLGVALLIVWLLSLVLMGGLIIFDVRWFLLPNKLIYPLILLSIVHRMILFSNNNEVFSEILLPQSLAVLVSSGVFWLLHRVSNGKWIGDGDYRLGLAIAFFLSDPVTAWLSLFVASLLGLAFAAPAYVSKKPKKKPNIKIPFGPSLILGLYFSYLFGEKIINWYEATFLYL